MTTASRISVGDHVKVRFGQREIPAIVIEDRGDYGTPPVQVVRVRWSLADADEAEEFEVSVRDVQRAAA